LSAWASKASLRKASTSYWSGVHTAKATEAFPGAVGASLVYRFSSSRHT
jgi:hypothetical protein